MQLHLEGQKLAPKTQEVPIKAFQIYKTLRPFMAYSTDAFHSIKSQVENAKYKCKWSLKHLAFLTTIKRTRKCI